MSHIGIYNPKAGMTREVCAGSVMGYREMALSGYWEAWSTGSPYYTDSYVDSSQDQKATGYLDTAKYADSRLSVSGWAYCNGGKQTVEIRIYKGNEIALTYNLLADKERPDVKSAMKYSTSQVGYNDSRNIKLEPGKYIVKAFAKSTELINSFTMTVATPKAVEPNYTLHQVSKGETLWQIAVKYLGKGSRWEEIQKLNGLKDTLIYPGQKLKIPFK